MDFGGRSVGQQVEMGCRAMCRVEGHEKKVENSCLAVHL